MKPTILIRLTAMGDVLLAVPTARALAAAGHEVHWVLHRRWAALAPVLPAARVHLLGSAAELLPLARRLRRLEPEAVIDLQGKPASLALSALIGAPVSRYGKRPWREQIAAARGAYPIRPADPMPVWLRYARVAGVEARPEGALLELAEPGLREAAAWLAAEAGLEPGRFTLFHPSAAHPGKRIPQEGIVTMLERLPRPLALIGDTDGTIVAGDGVIDLRGRTELRLLPYILHHAHGLVSTDSGPMHLGRAVGTPVAGLFFQTDPCLGFAPVQGRRVKIVSKPLPCKPCSLHGKRQPCPEGTWACRAFDWEALADDLAGFLGPDPGGSRSAPTISVPIQHRAEAHRDAPGSSPRHPDAAGPLPPSSRSKA
ncbi:MAG TPA: glycosyltransferase family 9 protein [Candidatus Ozemobacteraceae bacterium]|nr:glycosyltransferase family 9 protein [Candidatus Ozemobacteraceae bacterium]